MVALRRLLSYRARGAMSQRTNILFVSGLLALALFGVAAAGPLEDGNAAYRRGDYAAAMQILRPLAEQGNAIAQYNLGVMYEHGQGVAQNYAEAVKQYRLAADQGLAYAQNNLGHMYDEGRGVAENYPNALKWYRLAADQGSPDAQHKIGFLFALGYGVPQSDVEAVKWFQLATDRGNLNGQYALGNHYALGEGVPQNYIYAYMWLSLVAAASSDIIKVINARDYVAAKMTPDQMPRRSGWRESGSRRGEGSVGPRSRDA